MGGSVVVFDKNAGVNFTRNKKRMRGEIIKGPEVKKFNALSGGFQYTSYDFCNLIHAPEGTTEAFTPLLFSWPSMGSGAAQRIGNRITFLGFRMKGWLTLSPTQLKMIRWRFVLVRLDMPTGTVTFDREAYLSQFLNSSTVAPVAFDTSAYETYSRHNFYKKFKDVDNKSVTTKVLATGCLPATNAYQSMKFTLTGAMGNQSVNLTTGTVNPAFIIGTHSGNMGYIPIDVKVKLNDTIDCASNNRRYYLVFEADCGYGWTDQGSPSKDYVGVIANVYCRGYYTDE